MNDIGAKVAHVKRGRVTAGHTCHWPGCAKQVPPALWGCRDHWYTLPQHLRTRIWRTYRAGQEHDKKPSADYLEAANDVQAWIAQHGAAGSPVAALSLWQPWASLWIAGVKVHETRGWSTTHRGKPLVHASRQLERDVDPQCAAVCVRTFGADWRESLPKGALLGVLILADVVSTSRVGVFEGDDEWAMGNFGPGRYAFTAKAPQRWETPLPWRGERGVFRVPLEAVRELPGVVS